MGCCGKHHARATDQKHLAVWRMVICFLKPLGLLHVLWTRVVVCLTKLHCQYRGWRTEQLLLIVRHSDMERNDPCNLVTPLLKLMIRCQRVDCSNMLSLLCSVLCVHVGCYWLCSELSCFRGFHKYRGRKKLNKIKQYNVNVFKCNQTCL
jgi:hypothetical protein